MFRWLQQAAGRDGFRSSLSGHTIPFVSQSPSPPQGPAAGSLDNPGSPALHILILSLIYLASRLPVFFNLDHVVISWRPADNASMALNFFRNGLNILHPQIFWGGNGPGFVESEFPIVQFITAVLYRIFGVHEWLGLVVPFVSTLGIVLVTYLLVSRVFDRMTGFCAAAFVIISPSLTEYSETFYGDPVMVFFTVLGVYSYLRWLESDRGRYFALSAISVALAILIKLTALYIGLPLLFLSYTFKRWRFLRDGKHWAYFVVVLLPVVLWYGYSHGLYVKYGNTFGILEAGRLKTASASLLLSPGFYLSAVERVAFYHLSPIVFILFLAGLVVPQRDPLRYLFHVWAVSVGIYILVCARGVDSGTHYLLPAIAPGVSIASIALFAAAGNRFVRKVFGSPERGIFAGALAVCVFVMTTLSADVTFLRKDFWGPWSPFQAREKSFGLTVNHVTRPGSLIIVANSLMDGTKPEESMTPPDVFYFGDRRGWYRAFSWTSPEDVERLKSSGACYFVLSGNFTETFIKECPATYAYLESRYNVIMEDPAGLVVDLCTERNHARGHPPSALLFHR